MRDFATKAILIGTVVVTNLLASSLGVYWLYESRLQHERRAETSTQNLAYSVDQSITFTIDKIDLILQTTTEELERRLGAGKLDTAGLSRFVDSHAAHMPELSAIGIADEQGKIALSTGSTRITVPDIHEQGYFSELRDHPEKGLYISKPTDGLVGPKKVLVFARRYEYPNGSMAGVVTAALPLDFFVQLLAHFNAGRQDAISLRGFDNSVIVRYPVLAPGQPGSIGSTASSDELRQMIQAGQEQATFHADKTADGVARTFSIRRLESAPIYVVAGAPQEDYLEEWRAEVTKTVVFLLALLLVTSISAGFIYRLFDIAGRQSRRKPHVPRARLGRRACDRQPGRGGRSQRQLLFDAGL